MPSIAKAILCPTTRPDVAARDVETHYQLQQIAESVNDVAKFQATSLAMQCQYAQAAAEFDTALWEVSQDISAGFDLLAGQLSSIGTSLDSLCASSEEIRQAIESSSQLLHSDLQTVAALLLDQSQQLREIRQTLSKPYETQLLELRKEAEKWLRKGMARPCSDRSEDLNDAYGLLEECTKNPIGNQDYVVHFQIGWIRWKEKLDLEGAEASFHRATRLSEDSGNAYFVVSARHLAYLQYLQGNHPAALESIQRCLRASRSPNILFDAARYSARASRIPDAVRLLDEAVRCRPTLLVAMLTEKDFAI